MWPKLLSQETGYYTLEYAPIDDLARKRTKQVSGAHTSLMLSNLAPETTYEVALIPESNVHYFPPQTTRVTTLAGKMCTTVTKGEFSTVLSLTYIKQTGQSLVCIPQPHGLIGEGRWLWLGQNIMSCFMLALSWQFFP